MGGQWGIIALYVCVVVVLLVLVCRHASTVGNIIWFLVGGWWNFLLYGFLGVLFCITIIGIPVGKALFQYAKLMVFPFGKGIVRETDIKGKENVAAIRRVGGVIANIIWLPVGIVMFVGNVLLGVATAVTIVGIPIAIVLFRSAKFLIWPVGARVVTKQEAEAFFTRKAMVAAKGNSISIIPAAMPGQTVVQNGFQPVSPAGGQPIPGGQQVPYMGAPVVQSAPQTAAAPVPGRRFCSQCGTECSGEARFCPKCGAKAT